MDKIKIDKNNGIPKYIQLKDLLVREIATGNFRTGDKFYTERQLIDKYQVSTATIGNTMRAMVRDGWLTRRRGGGTYIDSISPQLDSQAVQVPELLLEGWPREPLRVRDSVNWFIRNEIQNGILNTYPGLVKIAAGHGPGGNKPQSVITLVPSSLQPEKLAAKGIHYIVIDVNCGVPPAQNCVTINQLSGIYELIAYLVRDLGHQHIGMISVNNSSHAARIAGFQIGLRSFDLPFREKYLVRTITGTEEDGRKAMMQLLELKPRPTAVFVDTDIKAIGAIEAVKNAGLRVPEDISIAGFDDIPGADSISPPLTTVKVPYYRLGCEAAIMLQERQQRNQDISSRILHTSLVIRNSCGINDG